MFRPGTVNEADYSPQEHNPQEQSASKENPPPFGNIQKISQEGSKNTYVIILSKDCIKGESHKGPPVIKCPPVGNHGRALPRRPLNGDIHDDDFDSPTSVNDEGKVSHPTEDVKLNLSNINDEDYDSNTSSTNVFLKPDIIQAGITQDSAIEADLSETSYQQDSSPNLSRSYYCEKSKMNTYVIPSPLTVQPEKRVSIGQHTFPMISPQCGKNSLLYNTPMHLDKQLNNSTARKIFLVTSEQDNGGVFKKTVAYTNEAVPKMGKSKLNEFSGSVSLLKKSNPKAVPTFNNISPINQTHVPSSSFVPINPSASPAFGAQFTNGPFTSTPVMSDTNPRLQQLKHESTSHRPVYVIQSPFSRQNSTETSGFIGNKTAKDFESSVIAASSVPTLSNNSSGFISGASSLELFETSSSVDSPRMKRDSDGMYSSTDICDSKLYHSSKETARTDSPCEHNVKQNVSTKIYEVNDGSGGMVVKLEEDDSTDGGIGLESETEPSVTSSQESEASDIVDIATLNKSLTNMQWLKGMQLKDDKTITMNTYTHQNPAIPWKSLSFEEIRQISEEYGRDRRPPFSYMIMIQMALYSRDDRKMMLKEICKWIEETFPYYKYTAKPGWKNSIRHNLSLYNIFERSPGKRHGSYWTIRPDMEPKTKPYRDRNSNLESRSSTPSLPSQAPGAMIPIIPMYSSMGRLSAITPGSVYMQPPTTTMSTVCGKKGPPPILPRPSPYGTPQAYALIPINGVGQQFGNASTMQAQQPMIVNFSNSSGQVSACPSPGITEMSAAVASIQMSSASPIPMEHGSSTAITEHKHTNVPGMSIVKQAWLDCQSGDTASSVDSDIATSNDMTSSNEIASSSEFTKNRGKSKRPRIINPGLPKPLIYVDKEKETKLIGSKRRKLQQKERPLLNDSSDEEEDEGEKFISNLVKDLTVPTQSQNTELEDPLTTSTPMKKVGSSSTTHLPSPISGFTPMRNSGLFDGSFLDTLTDRKNFCLSPSPCPKKGITTLNDSPNASILDFATIPTFNSPDKFGEGSPELNNPNLSKFLTECGLDPNFVENTENFPHLNWSSIQQIVDSMDTTE